MTIEILNRCPTIIPAETRANVGEIAARAAELTARRLFESRGNHSEVHLSELELALVAATAAKVALDATRRARSGG